MQWSSEGGQQWAAGYALRLFTFCAGLTAGLDIVLRALCIMTGAGDVAVPFLVSDVPCPGVVSILRSVLNSFDPCAVPDAKAGRGLTKCPPVGEPEDNQLVLWGETPTPGTELLSCSCLVRINPLLPVTELCSRSVSGIPFSLTISKVLLLHVSEQWLGLLRRMSSHSMPLNIASVACLPATSFFPSVNQNQKHKANDNINKLLFLKCSALIFGQLPEFSSPLLVESSPSFFADTPFPTLPLARPAGWWKRCMWRENVLLHTICDGKWKIVGGNSLERI